MIKSILLAITLLAFSALSALPAIAAPQASQAAAQVEIIKEKDLGKGKRVTEKITEEDGSGKCEAHYQGLGEKGVNTGKRYRKLSDGTWQYDGDWKRNGDDIDVTAGDTLVWRNEDMGKAGETHGSITNILGGGHGSWGDA